MSQFFTSGGQSIGASASASVLPMNIQDWFSLGLTGLIFLQSKRLSRVLSNTTVQKRLNLESNKCGQKTYKVQIFILSTKYDVLTFHRMWTEWSDEDNPRHTGHRQLKEDLDEGFSGGSKETLEFISLLNNGTSSQDGSKMLQGQLVDQLVGIILQDFWQMNVG